ncbi:hypothetical protein Rhopal_007352-T1 [Rhodotorula paludigena]|uniref:Uncharacterized protein n=1 Tax=Rhodotorula paludigena TaxID=86838 RepID=A0AAV5GVL4_9BASI|nr:hypothetical protein Rhopal_007352-T1 [Rhodotorula paludigena]
MDDDAWPPTARAQQRAQALITAYFHPEDGAADSKVRSVPHDAVGDYWLEQSPGLTKVVRLVLEARASTCLVGNHWSCAHPLALALGQVFSEHNIFVVECACDLLAAVKWGVQTLSHALGFGSWSRSSKDAAKALHRAEKDRKPHDPLVGAASRLRSLDVLVIHGLDRLSPGQLQYLDRFFAVFLSNGEQSRGGLQRVQVVGVADFRSIPPRARPVGNDKDVYKVPDAFVKLLKRPSTLVARTLELDPPTYASDTFRAVFEVCVECPPYKPFEDGVGPDSTLALERSLAADRNPVAGVRRQSTPGLSHLAQKGRNDVSRQPLELWRSLCSSLEYRVLSSTLHARSRVDGVNATYERVLYDAAPNVSHPGHPQYGIEPRTDPLPRREFSSTAAYLVSERILQARDSGVGPILDLDTAALFLPHDPLLLTVGTRVMFDASFQPHPQHSIARRQFGIVVGFAKAGQYNQVARASEVVTDNCEFVPRGFACDGLVGAVMVPSQSPDLRAMRSWPTNVTSESLPCHKPDLHPLLHAECLAARLAMFDAEEEHEWPIVLLDRFGAPHSLSSRRKVVLVRPALRVITVGDVYEPGPDLDGKHQRLERRAELCESLADLGYSKREQNDPGTAVALIVRPANTIALTTLNGHYIPDVPVTAYLDAVHSSQPMWLSAAVNALRLVGAAKVPRSHWDSEFGALTEWAFSLDWLNVVQPDKVLHPDDPTRSGDGSDDVVSGSGGSNADASDWSDDASAALEDDASAALKDDASAVLEDNDVGDVAFNDAGTFDDAGTSQRRSASVEVLVLLTSSDADMAWRSDGNGSDSGASDGGRGDAHDRRAASALSHVEIKVEEDSEEDRRRLMLPPDVHRMAELEYDHSDADDDAVDGSAGEAGAFDDDDEDDPAEVGSAVTSVKRARSPTKSPQKDPRSSPRRRPSKAPRRQARPHSAVDASRCSPGSVSFEARDGARIVTPDPLHVPDRLLSDLVLGEWEDSFSPQSGPTAAAAAAVAAHTSRVVLPTSDAASLCGDLDPAEWSNTLTSSPAPPPPSSGGDVFLNNPARPRRSVVPALAAPVTAPYPAPEVFAAVGGGLSSRPSVRTFIVFPSRERVPLPAWER